MFHEDLNLYKQKKFRSYSFIKHIWDCIESTILFYLGILKNQIVTITYDSSKVYVTITCDYKTYCTDVIDININNILTYCENFTIDININFQDKKAKYVSVENCCFYYYSKEDDDGLIEFTAETSIDYKSFKKLKHTFILCLTLESQYAISKNFVSLNLDTLKTEIDCYYEYIFAYARLKKISLYDSILRLTYLKKINKETGKHLLVLVDMLGNKNEKRTT